MTTLPARNQPNDYLRGDPLLRKWLLSTDHKRIGILYLLSITLFFVIGGLAAMLVRLELLTPESDLLHKDTYNRAFSIHGITMVWFFLIPSIPSVFGNFLLPMMIGARDMAFPRLNLLSWYLFVLGGLFAVAVTIFGGIDTGWTFYTPLSTQYVTAIILMLATPVLAISLVLVGIERIWGVGIFDPELGGDPILFQHFFWFYSHPAVYIMVLPAMGVVSEIIPCYARRPIFGYKFIAAASLAIAIIGFFVWGHHMFVSGQSTYASVVFSILSFLVAVPSAVKVFNWAFTLRGGHVYWRTPFIYAIGFAGLFTIGGLTGLFVASTAVDVHLHDTYFVVAHFHYIMVGGTVMAYLGAVHFWWPKLTGRRYNDTLGILAALMLFLGFNLTFFPQFILGYLGMPRRYAAYEPEYQMLNVLSTAGSSILAVGYLFPLVYLLWSFRKPPDAGPNPVGATGLEWQTSSPPPTHNFQATPIVTQAPYRYDLKVPQGAEPGDEELAAARLREAVP